MLIEMLNENFINSQNIIIDGVFELVNIFREK